LDKHIKKKTGFHRI